jgi:hypothetical protein
MLKFYEHNVDLHTFILFRVFDGVWSSLEGVSEFRARACSKDDMEHAKNTCQLLEWLGFVEPDSTSPFGYRPTQDLIGIILKRGLRRPPGRPVRSPVPTDRASLHGGLSNRQPDLEKIKRLPKRSRVHLPRIDLC